MLAKASKLDVVWRKLLLTKFFTKGWGSVDNLKRMCKFGQVISDRSRCKHLVDKTYPVFIDKNEKRGEYRILEGHFLSPFAKYMKGIMPKEVETARFQVLLPVKWKSERKPICIHLAGTGDHGFWRRRTLMARPLLKEHGIASIILENPFYGVRKPKEQSRSSLLNVSDLFVMGGALVLETLTLLHWCEKEGYGPLGVSGVSMGGHMATLAVTNWHKPIALIPCLSWSNATPTFTQGVMSGSIPWETLASEYVFHSDYEAEILRKLLKCPQYDAYRLGQEFAANFPESMEELNKVALKSGLGSSLQDQPKPEPKTATVSLDGERDAVSLKDNMDDLELDQQSSMCNVASQVASVPGEPNRQQNDSILEGRDGLKSPSDTCQISEANFTEVTNPETALDAETQNRFRTQNNQRTSVEDFPKDAGHSYSDTESSDTSTVRLNLNEPSANAHPSSDSVRGSSSSRIDHQDDRSSHSSEADDQRSKSNTSAKDEGRKKKSKGKQDKSSSKMKLSKEEYQAVKNDALQFMKGVMDAATFVGNFSKPVDPELVLSILANQDAYIPWYQMPSLKELWPGMEVRYVNSGHVAAILFKQHHFRRAITDTFDKMEKKYHGVFPEES